MLIEFIPFYLRLVPLLFSDGLFPVDVAVVQLAPPNDEGYCSFGVANDYTMRAAENARIVIGEINDQTPFTFGDNYIHLTDLDYIIECSYPLVETPSPEATEVEFAIAKHCASLIKDGDTLQLGIGGLPNAVLASLKDRKDLGIHTELFTEGIIDLVNEGVITGKRKTLHPNKIIAT